MAVFLVLLGAALFIAVTGAGIRAKNPHRAVLVLIGQMCAMVPVFVGVVMVGAGS